MTAARAASIEDVDTVWRAGLPSRAPAPALDADIEVDVAIIGGGLCGLSTAHHLLERHAGLSLAIVEAASLGYGASGRNGGLVLTGMPGSSASTPDLARRDYELTRNAIDDIERITSELREHGLPVPFRRDGSVQIYMTERGAAGAADGVELHKQAGVDLGFLDRDALGEWIAPRGAVAGVVDPSGGHLNSLAYVRALADLALRRGARLFEGTRVTRLETGEVVKLHTAGGTVRARAAFVATNAYTPQLGLFRRAIIPVHSHVVATAPAPESTWRDAGWRRGIGFDDDQSRLSYSSLTERGNVLFGGGSNAAYDYRYGSGHALPAEPRRGYAAVEQKLREYFPGSAGVPIAHRWSGAIGMTLTRMCTMGVLGEPPNLYYAVGFSGQGITLATLAGRVLADLYDGDHDRWRSLPFYQYRPPPFPPEPLRWLGYQAYTRFTGYSPRRDL